jgi:hypothetical protein
MAWPGTGRHQEQRKEVARYIKGKYCGKEEETGELLSINIYKTKMIVVKYPSEGTNKEIGSAATQGARIDLFG